MDENYPQGGSGSEDQDPYYPERTVVDPLLTGDARVDAAVADLTRLAGAPVDDHVAVLEEVHGRLRDILGELAEGQP